ncbi:hypothetical protein FJT64_006145 [Amphibalanus amphitrite]|uniref:Uncharacterized protein n=1 Tax=Amphibalanus amphitrite TaxID=1232801 RepID=A0A6A4W004_AMPAM|nr:hypothetical protein FJT64_006145 [Amphibalanus amphitrite]
MRAVLWALCCAALLLSAVSSRVELVDNGYRGLVVGIDDRVSVQECQDVLSSVKRHAPRAAHRLAARRHAGVPLSEVFVVLQEVFVVLQEVFVVLQETFVPCRSRDIIGPLIETHRRTDDPRTVIGLGGNMRPKIRLENGQSPVRAADPIEGGMFLSGVPVYLRTAPSKQVSRLK